LLRRHQIEDSRLCDSAAENYALFDEQHPMANLQFKKWISNLVAEKKPRFILDLACGSGRYFSFLKGELIVGIDYSTGMLKQAKKFKHFNLIRADLFNLPFRANIFDLMISMSAIGEHCPLTKKLLEGIKFVLNMNGIFAFTVIPLHHRLFPYKGTVSLLWPLAIINFIQGTGGPVFSASKVEVRNKLRRLKLNIIQMKENHGKTVPHFFVVVRHEGQS